MEFTYQGYGVLLELLRESGYAFCGYHDWQPHRDACVILRHDVDSSLKKAAELARFEKEQGIASTYFILLRTAFYNPASAASLAEIRMIQECGHEIGLHFDEMQYPCGTDLPAAVEKEAAILESLLDTPVRSVSMHRPSARTLEADYSLGGRINSYGSVFFRAFKYLSDSRRHWREDVEAIVRSKQHRRLHILTHPFWYHEQEIGLQETLTAFINAANRERYCAQRENFRDLEEVVKPEEVR